jgi:multidrug efflux system outer membrane protein
VLQSLLQEALAANDDLEVATARVAEARALAGVVRSERFPSVGAELDVTGAQVAGPGSTTSRRATAYSASLPISWEIDVWGRVRNRTHAAFARWRASEEARRDVMRIVVAEVAQAYFELVALDLEIEISRDTLEQRSRTHGLFQKRFDEGAENLLVVSRAKADRAAVAATVPAIERAMVQKENQIALLLGRAPGSIPRGGALSRLTLPPQVPAGLPSTLLVRRPDVRASEQRLHAAAADIGAAQADFFPRFSLTALLGLESTQLSDLVTGRSTTWALGGNLLGPLFDGGLRRSNLAAARAAWCTERAVYVQTVHRALRETADALVAIRTLREQREHSEVEVQAREEALKTAWTRYDGGVSSYFEVLDSQRELFPSRILLARAIRDQLVAVVQLYRALGGGWQQDCGS